MPFRALGSFRLVETNAEGQPVFYVLMPFRALGSFRRKSNRRWWQSRRWCLNALSGIGVVQTKRCLKKRGRRKSTVLMPFRALGSFRRKSNRRWWQSRRWCLNALSGIGVVQTPGGRRHCLRPPQALNALSGIGVVQTPGCTPVWAGLVRRVLMPFRALGSFRPYYDA